MVGKGVSEESQMQSGLWSRRCAKTAELGDRRVGAAAKPPREIIDRQALVPRQPLVLAELEPSFVECSAQALLVLLDEQRDLAAGHGAAEDEDQKGGVAEQAHA